MKRTIKTLLHITFCELSHNGAADSLLDKKCTYCNCEIKYVYIAN
jgi:hypothetical protein